MIHAQNIVVQKFLSELRGMPPHPRIPLDPPLLSRRLWRLVLDISAFRFVSLYEILDTPLFTAEISELYL